jgi:hypothetical protein
VLDEIRVGRSFGVVYLPQGGVRRRTGDHLRTREYREVLLHLHQYAPDVINYFRTKAARFKHEPDRIELSIARAISPLVDAVESAYVERSWRELSLIELRRIVERGLSVELILLRRSPETARAQELAGRRGSSRAYINLAVRLVG